MDELKPMAILSYFFNNFYIYILFCVVEAGSQFSTYDEQEFMLMVIRFKHLNRKQRGILKRSIFVQNVKNEQS